MKALFSFTEALTSKSICLSRSTRTMGEVLFASHVPEVRLDDQNTPLGP